MCNGDENKAFQKLVDINSLLFLVRRKDVLERSLRERRRKVHQPIYQLIAFVHLSEVLIIIAFMIYWSYTSQTNLWKKHIRYILQKNYVCVANTIHQNKFKYFECFCHCLFGGCYMSQYLNFLDVDWKIYFDVVLKHGFVVSYNRSGLSSTEILFYSYQSMFKFKRVTHTISRSVLY